MTKTLRPAGFWIRLLADVLDSLLLNVVAWGVELVFLGALYWCKRLTSDGAYPDLWSVMDPLTIQIVNAVIYVSLAAPYYILGHEWWGTTLGKYPFKIKVIDAEEGGAITRRQSVIRFLSYGVSYAIFCAGFLMVVTQKDKRALHELFSGTRSVRG